MDETGLPPRSVPLHGALVGGCDRCGVAVSHEFRLDEEDDVGARVCATPEGWATLSVVVGGETIDAFDVCAPCLATVLAQFPDPVTEPEPAQPPESEDVP